MRLSRTRFLLVTVVAAAMPLTALAKPPFTLEVTNPPGESLEVTNPPGETLEVTTVPGTALAVENAVRKVPVRCAGFARAGERDDTAARLTCRTQDLDDTRFDEVPAGMYVALTDVAISAPNIASIDQRYNLSIGEGTRFGLGGKARFIGTTDTGSRSHFTTPFAIATEGRFILVSNVANNDDPRFVGIDVNVEVFGFMAEIETLGY